MTPFISTTALAKALAQLPYLYKGLCISERSQKETLVRKVNDGKLGTFSFHMGEIHLEGAFIVYFNENGDVEMIVREEFTTGGSIAHRRVPFVPPSAT